MHKKPTKPFGHVAFSKEGKVTRRIFRLSNIKEDQEREALARFVERFNHMANKLQITDVMQLPEQDQDFQITVGNRQVQVQLTELVDKFFATPMSEDEVKAGKWGGPIMQREGKVFKIDVSKKNAALANLIDKKLAKQYSKDNAFALWLVVFTTLHYVAEYIQGGQLYITEALGQAQDRLQSRSSVMFDEIWFTDLQTQPVRIWPISEENNIRAGDA